MEYLAYHGDENKFNKFDINYAGKIEAYDADGPGIYFTNSKKNAEMYGKWIYKVVLKPNKIISNTVSSQTVDKNLIKRILDTISKEDYPFNWSEDMETDKLLSIDSIFEASVTEDEIFHYVRNEFFASNPQKFFEILKVLGFDMLVVGKPDFKFNDVKNVEHYIVYNPDIIQIKKIYKSSIQERIRKIIKNILKEERFLDKKLSDTVGTKYVTMYRAVKQGIDKIYPKDFVTLSKKFAVEHAENNEVVYDEKYVVLQALTTTNELYEAGNPGEYLYGADKPKKAKIIYISKGEDYDGYDENKLNE